MAHKIFQNRKCIFQAVLTACCLIIMVACSENEEPAINDGRIDGLHFCLSLSNYSSIPGTRALTEADNSEGTQDQWSYRDFTSGDIVGLYANTNSGAIGNLPMLFSASETANGNNYSFGPANGQSFNPTEIKGSSTFLYFPFSDQMPTLEKPSLGGMSLRALNEPYTSMSHTEGPLKCIDFLISSQMDFSKIESGMIYGAMVHAFSELIIMRGEGFDNPQTENGSRGDDAYKIIVKLKQPYTHVQIQNKTNPWSCAVNLAYDPAYIPEGMTSGEFDASIWEAWKGGNYGETTENPTGDEAWYVILPTIGSGASLERSEVEYIQLYDNEGTLQTIKDLYLSGRQGYVHHQQGNYLDSQFRYPMVISMKELVPTVFPFSIENWEEDDITNARTRGITQQNLNDFLLSYSSFILNGRSENEETVLLNFGDKIKLANGTSYWHFYILDNLDLGAFETESPINNLQDVIDGRSSPAASPVKLTNLKVPLVNSMTNGYDSLLNVTIESPYIINERNSAIGTLSNSMTGGGIDNCLVSQGYIHTSGPVGMFVGAVSNGAITNSKATGVLVGSMSDSESGFLVGTSNVGNIYTGNNPSVVFSNINGND